MFASARDRSRARMPPRNGAGSALARPDARRSYSAPRGGIDRIDFGVGGIVPRQRR
jgi:hypothetical protein